VGLTVTESARPAEQMDPILPGVGSMQLGFVSETTPDRSPIPGHSGVLIIGRSSIPAVGHSSVLVVEKLEVVVVRAAVADRSR
jgi:hypothetical protein